MTWVLSMKADDEGYHVFATYAGHCFAFFNLFRDYHKSMSPELKRELSHHFRGLRNQIADALGNGEGKVARRQGTNDCGDAFGNCDRNAAVRVTLHYCASARVQRTTVTRVRRSDCGNLP
ncbi:TPA: hypothetical protein N0F65_006713 [Lagenidium giganteum]|uniref:Uncharacterized protein n=1 Tax=Lagenidium giganteum TaxID=4803 RepID=A0AAV2Z7W4_9STRA|nr:TPA: hypothetical protein N0F65_006713 [Lagenidium giganteum]